MTRTHVFPDSFAWGVATSSYQIEGAVTEDGRGESIWDRFTYTPGTVADGSTGDVACDHYHRYADDVRLMQQLGVNAYRFSVAWPRILPDGVGQPNAAGLDFYSRLVDALLEANITPFITLYHWDLPQALQDAGGWNNRDTAYAFADYAEVVAAHLGDRVTYWMTHNELWCTVFLGHQLGIFAPGITDFKIALQAAHHVLLSHGLAAGRLRPTLGPDAQIGVAPNIGVPYTHSTRPQDRAAVTRFDGYMNRWFLDPLAGRGYPPDMWEFYDEQVPQVQPGDMDLIAAPLDFLGVNYYNTSQVIDDTGGAMPQATGVANPDLPRTADREIDPGGLYLALTRLHRDYDFPAFYITENGAAYPDQPDGLGQVHDTERIAFLASHFAQAARAIEAGVPLQGYFVWSLMDNFEWASGYTLRYGIVHVDFETQARTLKASARWYRHFIACARPSSGAAASG